jgi:hypothetical protein
VIDFFSGSTNFEFEEARRKRIRELEQRERQARERLKILKEQAEIIEKTDEIIRACHQLKKLRIFFAKKTIQGYCNSV